MEKAGTARYRETLCPPKCARIQLAQTVISATMGQPLRQELTILHPPATPLSKSGHKLGHSKPFDSETRRPSSLICITAHLPSHDNWRRGRWVRDPRPDHVVVWLWVLKSHNLGGDSEGWGTALKPAHEPIVVARKPLKGTVADNVLRHGTGALNIDASRISTDDILTAGAGGLFSHIRDGKAYPNRTRENEASANTRYSDSGGTDFAMIPGVRGGDERGRWPANVIHDGSDEVLASFPPGSRTAGT